VASESELLTMYPNHNINRNKGNKRKGSVVRDGSKVVGEVLNGVFVKNIYGSRHMLRSPKAVCFGVESLHNAENLGAKEVAVIDQETGKEYRAPLPFVWEHGFNVNRGFGQQVGVTLGDFAKAFQPPPPDQLSFAM
jgi:hypothetical protein